MKKIQVLRIGIFVAAIGLITIGAIAGLQWKERHDFIKNSALYEDTTHGFTMRYPNTWVLLSQKDLEYRNEQFVVGVNIVSEPSTAAGVIVKDRTNQESLDTASIMDSIEKNFSATYTDFKKISSKKVRHDAYQEFDIEYTYKRSERVRVHQQQRVVITITKIYFLSGSALVVDYPQRQKDIRHILASFQLAEQ